MVDSLRRFFSDLAGPSAVIAAGTMGAGAVTALLLSGAWFQYSLIWVVLLMAPFFIVAINTATRIGVLNHDAGLMKLVGTHTHTGVVWMILLINIPLHFLVCMGQMSVMYSAFMTLTGLDQFAFSESLWGQILFSTLIASCVLTLVLSQGYQRMQTVMTWLMVVMFVCFLVIAFKGFVEWRRILEGVVPHIPADLEVEGVPGGRSALTSIVGIVGSAIAPAALLGMPYYAADARLKTEELGDDLRKTIVNLGIIFTLYAIFIIIAGGYALHPLSSHGEIDSISEAGQVLNGAFPPLLSAVGPKVFALGIFLAALTTLVVTAQIASYILLDGTGRSWKYTSGNKPYLVCLSVMIVGAAIIGPLWDFPALLKVLLLMAANLVIVPTVLSVVIYLSRRRSVMGNFTAGGGRTLLLLVLLAVSLFIAVYKFPGLVNAFTASISG